MDNKSHKLDYSKSNQELANKYAIDQPSTAYKSSK